MTDRYITVYLIEYQGNVMYVGKTKNYKRRKQMHLNCRGTYKSAIPTDIDICCVKINPIQTFDNEKDALCMENELIQAYDTIDKGWNRYRSGLVSKDINEYQREYQKTPKYKAYKREYHMSTEYKKRDSERNQTPERKAYLRNYYLRKKALKNGLPI